MDEGLKRYAVGTTNDFGEGYCKCTPTLLPDKDGRAVLYADHVAYTEAMRKALEAAWHALKSYEYGNASPDLAREVGLVIYTALAARAAVQGTEGQ
jgi:hypothetical protein